MADDHVRPRWRPFRDAPSGARGGTLACTNRMAQPEAVQYRPFVKLSLVRSHAGKIEASGGKGQHLMTTSKRRSWLAVLTVCILLFAAAGSYLGYLWIVVGGETARRESLDRSFTPEPLPAIFFEASVIAIVVALVVGSVAAGQLLPRKERRTPRERL